ncbi:MAG: glycosyltransferase [Actinomycetes bacterium]
MGVDASVGQLVVAVVVAWNRRDLLAQTLAGLAAQTRPPDAVVVVDNASSDDSAALAEAHRVVTEVVRLPRNTGGAGGFAAGIARAVATHDAELVWIMDDDTVPTPPALAELLAARVRYPGRVTVAASRADWRDGREHPMNTPRVRPLVSRMRAGAAELAGAHPIRSASFVSILLDAEAVRAHGLPIADYFLWNDDFEYTARLLRHGVGLYVPASRVYHLTKVFGSSDADPGPRFVNEVRNKVWLFTRSDALGPLDRVLYAGSTLRRWARMLARSADRRALAGYGRRGLAESLRAPRSTVEVLAGTPVAADVAAIERRAGRG